MREAGHKRTIWFDSTRERYLESSNSQKLETKRWLSDSGRRGGGGLWFKSFRVSVWEDQEVLETDGGDGCTTVRRYLVPLNRALKNG